MEKISSAIEKHTSSQLQDLKLMITQYEERIEKWRVNLEDTEGKKFIEIHSAMKILNGNFTKSSKDNKDRFELLQKEF